MAIKFFSDLIQKLVPQKQKPMSPEGNKAMLDKMAVQRERVKVMDAHLLSPTPTAQVGVQDAVQVKPRLFNDLAGVKPVMAQQTTPTPTPTPMPTKSVIKLSRYIPVSEKTPYDPILDEVFGEHSPNFKRVLGWNHPDGRVGGGENRGFDPIAKNVNTKAKGIYAGSTDIGLFQINDVVFRDYKKRMPGKMKAIGVNTIDDLYDPKKNALMARLIFDNQGYGAWYGAPPDLRGAE